MGEIVEVDPAQLRVTAGRVRAAADSVAQITCAAIDSGELPGSRVGGIAGPALARMRLGDVAAGMRGWAIAARLAADAFDRTERRNGDRFGQ